ncbi:MAG TPA: hypothetical protein VMC09_11690 [Anaerolineales bacterium]|nr:hypothetical protein [Anaerolineales bacterium]
MNISPTEAEEALAAIQTMAQKTRKSIASGGTYITLIITGLVWLIGFLSTQFLPVGIVAYIWGGLSLTGTIAGIVLGSRMGNRVRSPSTAPMIRRVGLFWLLLAFFALAVIAVARPADGKQATLLVILFLMLGQMAMGLLFSFSSVWWTLPITALALVGYFLLPGIFYLWMAILGGGGMIALGLYIRLRW